MGEAFIEVSHAGERAIKFSATTYAVSSGFGFNAFWIASLALSWVSVSVKRALIEAPSRRTLSAAMLAALSAASTRSVDAASKRIPVLATDTCTAGASPNRFGRAYKPPTAIANAISTYFQSG